VINILPIVMDPSEVEFLAEKELVQIVPNFSQDRIYLIGGDFGPFIPSMPTAVPLWLAVDLKNRRKCRIVPPEWMTLETLEEKKSDETASQYFTPMPSAFYAEMTKLLLDAAPEDVPHADGIRVLVKDIWDARMAKLRSSVDNFIKSEGTHAKLDNLTLLELNTIRPLLTGSLDDMHYLRTGSKGWSADQSGVPGGSMNASVLSLASGHR